MKFFSRNVHDGHQKHVVSAVSFLLMFEKHMKRLRLVHKIEDETGNDIIVCMVRTSCSTIIVSC
jgi:hypothetical protein